MSKTIEVAPFFYEGAKVKHLLEAPDGRFYVSRENKHTVLAHREDLERAGWYG